MDKTEVIDYLYMIKNKKIQLAAFIAVGVVLAAIVYFNNPVETKWLPKCILYWTTGLHCAGCGGTRALYNLLHGNFLISLRYNCLLIPSLITIIVLQIRPEWDVKRGLAYGVLITVVLYTLLRNLPFYPFTLLAPIAA